jgi:sulfite exporter TauE/SafE
MWPLLVSTFGVAVVHALAPDHWVPFVAIGRAQNWSAKKLMLVTLLAGIGHVGSSIVLGLIGLALGFLLKNVQTFESARGEIAGLILIGFGLAYAIWGLKQVRHGHMHIEKSQVVTIWTLIAIFVLGPCEPLIPLMLLAAQHGWAGIWLVSLLFSVGTIAMMLGQALLVYWGVRLLPTERLERWTHALAGLMIALTGLLVMALGI